MKKINAKPGDDTHYTPSMSGSRPMYPLYTGFFVCLLFLFSCRTKEPRSESIVSTPEELSAKSAELITDYFKGNSGDTTLQLLQPEMSKFLYEKNGYAIYWSEKEGWKPGADSMYQLIKDSRYYGLFPEDYHLNDLSAIREQFIADSLSKNARKDAWLWSKADIMLTDAFVRISRDIKIGRLPNDSVTLNKDSIIAEEFYLQQLQTLPGTGAVTALMRSLEPGHWGYWQLKKGIRNFLKEANFREYTFVPSPRKNAAEYKAALQKRLFEEGYITFDSLMADSVQLAEAVKKFQKEKGITVDGKAGEGTVRMLNLSDREKFIRIAISMDKYKKLPPAMPSRYIWVNTSSNYLAVVKDEKVEFSSRVISGKPLTRTPLLNGAVSVLITYPQWVPPPSIVSKEILPAVKKNPGYLARKGFSLLDREGNEVDPFTVDWSQYSRSIPYKVVQGSGDANALGILKFHFDNKYSVYLHDTNQRYLFGNAARSLSHGCVRVQEWEKLALFILQNDSQTAVAESRKIDSLRTWLKNKEKHHIGIKNKVPVYIRYFSCEGKDGSIVFYDDVYGDDKMLREKYFAGK